MHRPVDVAWRAARSARWPGWRRSRGSTRAPGAGRRSRPVVKARTRFSVAAAGVVRPHQPLRVGRARPRREVEVVDHVAAVGRQRRRRRGSRSSLLRGLAYWPAIRPILTTGSAGAVGEHDRHLQDRLDPVADVVGGRRGERLGAVAALQHERLARARPRPAGRAACRTRRRTPAAGRSTARRRPSSSAPASGQRGCWAAGRSRQASRPARRRGIASISPLKGSCASTAPPRVQKPSAGARPGAGTPDQSTRRTAQPKKTSASAQPLGWHRLELGRGLRQRHPHDVHPAQGHHHPEVPLVHRLDRVQAEAGGQHPVVRRGRAAALDVAEHDRAGLVARCAARSPRPATRRCRPGARGRTRRRPRVLQRRGTAERQRALGHHDRSGRRRARSAWSPSRPPARCRTAARGRG